MRCFGLVLCLLLGVFVSGRPARGQSEEWISRLPTVDLEGLDPAVAEQLAGAREWTVETWSSEGSSTAERLERLWDLAVAWHAYELFAAAETAYSLGMELAPLQERWLYAAGVLAADRGDFETAVQRFRAVLERLPGAVLPSLRLGLALRELDRNSEAEGILLEVLEAEPGNLAAEAALGEIAVANGHYEDGIFRLERVLKRIPAANRLHYSLALAYRGLGNQEQAREHLRLRGVVGIRPDDPFRDELAETARGERLALIRGREAFRAARYEEARTLFDQALSFAPDSVRALTDRAAARAALGDSAGASEDLERALTLDPDSATVRFNLARLLIHEERFTEAVPLLAVVVQESPGDDVALKLLGLALRRSGRPREAARVLEVLADLSVADEGVHLDLAESRVEAELYVDAVQGLETAHRLLPNSGLIAHVLARLLAAVPVHELRDGERALQLALAVYEASPTVTHAETVALALAESGRCDEAAEWQEAAIRGAQEVVSVSKLESMHLVAAGLETATGECRP
ncbi:MAG: tetratricopeptide repeat protein [Thermoanaerobaculia bacterium]|nr:tetratricopeptide repeat protein [Thermoanaerobaculia bacterium]